MAHSGRPSPSSGAALNDASKGEIVAVRDLEGIVALRPGRIVIARIRGRDTGRRGLHGPSRRVLSRAKDSVVGAMDVAGLVTAKELGLKLRIEFAVLPATIEAAERGVDVLLLVPEERAAETVQAIEAANARLEDKIPYESVTLG